MLWKQKVGCSNPIRNKPTRISTNLVSTALMSDSRQDLWVLRVSEDAQRLIRSDTVKKPHCSMVIKYRAKVEICIRQQRRFDIQFVNLTEHAVVKRTGCVTFSFFNSFRRQYREPKSCSLGNVPCESKQLYKIPDNQHGFNWGVQNIHWRGKPVHVDIRGYIVTYLLTLFAYLF